MEAEFTSASPRARKLLLLFLPLALLAAVGVRMAIPGLTGKLTASALSPKRSDVVYGSWYHDANGFIQAQDEHLNRHAPLMIYFYTDWCPYCKRLDNDLLPSHDVAEFMKSTIRVRINPEAGPEERALADCYGVRGYPSIFITPADSDQAMKIYPFKRVGETFVAMEPSEFVSACRAAIDLR